MGFEILNSLPSEDFVEAFNAAGTRLQAEAGRRGLVNWDLFRQELLTGMYARGGGTSSRSAL